MSDFTKRLMHAWNTFRDRGNENEHAYYDSGSGSSWRPDRLLLRSSNERSIIIAAYNRIAVDVAALDIQHVRVDENDQFTTTIDSGLNYILTQEANLDQTSTAFLRDIIMSLFDEGCLAVVPVDTTINPSVSAAFDVQSMRTGKILEWYPSHIRVRVYNEKTGRKQEIRLEKKTVAIIENPLYAIMNEPNSTLQRLIRKLNILDAIDEQSGSGKLDIIIQLPYVIKSQARRDEAEQRLKDIELQLSGSKYGIVYTDGTEKVTQLNRPAENNLMKQIEYLTTMLYNQLGLTEAVFNGTADEAAMLNYYNRTIIPLAISIIEEFKRKFLTKTARTQKQSIMYFRDAFRFVTAEQLAEIADKFTRNEILSSNEVRAIIGYKPSNDPRANELVNKNLNAPEEENGDVGKIKKAQKALKKQLKEKKNAKDE